MGTAHRCFPPPVNSGELSLYKRSEVFSRRMSVDALGNVWVAEFSFGREDRSGKWTVFDPDGRMLGVVQVPRNGRKIDIGEDYLTGMWRTELDVEQVRMYRLYRN